MSKAHLLDDGDTWDLDSDEWDAVTITNWLEVRDFEPMPIVPAGSESRWAHANDEAWPMVDLPDGMTVAQARRLMVTAAEAQDEEDRAASHPWISRANPYKDKKGKFTFKPVPDIGGAGVSAMPPAKQINRSHLSNPDTPRTRKVSAKEFQNLAGRGRTRLAGMRANSKPATAITDGARFRKVKDRAWDASREPWGGATVNPQSGGLLAGDEDLFALTVKPPGVDSVRIPASATREEFDAAMDTAAARFGEQLTYEGSHLGIFHDDDLKSIDIDPVTVVDNLDDVETIGAYTNAVGGAYRFSDGNGYWPPYVDD